MAKEHIQKSQSSLYLQIEWFEQGIIEQMAEEIFIDTDDLQRRMDGALSSMKGEFASLRTGRASSSMLDPITVEVYGQRTPLNQLGTINVPEPRDGNS